jgi:cell division transport system permease protein
MTEELEVWAYFRKDVPRDAATKASKPIAGWPEVRSVKFVTKEEAWERQKHDLPGTARLGDFDNPLPDAVCVKVYDPSQSAGVGKRLERLPGIKVVNWGGSLARSLMKLKRAVNWTGIVVSLLVAIAGVFIVHNTIRLALHTRWREIYIMQLVGATRAVIAAPFLLEGMIHGLLGATIACCVLIPAHMYLRGRTEGSFLELSSNHELLFFGLCLLAAGGFLGLTGSAVSVRRYLRRKPEWHG